MIVKEYRLLLPLTVEEYQIAQLYMVAKASLEETGKTLGEGVEIVRNEPYVKNEHGMKPGQYTEKKMYLKSKVPSFLRMIMPESSLVLTEYSWNAYPHCKTIYKNDWLGEKFYLSVESMHTDEPGMEDNVLNLQRTELANRSVEYLNIACDDAYAPMIKGEDPRRHLSRTGRGQLKPRWFLDYQDTVMCAYKLVKVHVKVFGIQSKAEEWGQFYGMRVPFVQYHRKLVCWMDEWIGMKMEDIREMERQTKDLTAERLG